MLSSLILAVVAAPDTPQQVLGRFKAYMSSRNGFSTDFRVHINDSPGFGTGTLAFQRPNRQYFRVQWGKDQFVLKQDATGILELNPVENYYEWLRPSQVFVGSRQVVSGLYKYCFPTFLIQGDLLSLLGRDAKLSIVDRPKIDGTATVHVKGKNERNGTGIEIDAYVTASGLLKKCRIKQSLMEESIIQDFAFSKSGALTPNLVAMFNPEPPTGSTPFSLDSLPYPIQIGEKFAFSALAKATRLSSTAAAPTDPTLIVFTEENCEISASANPFIQNLAERLNEMGCNVVEVVTAKTRPQGAKVGKGRAVVWDHAGSLDRLLKPQGYPAFFLISKDGTVEKLWLGFDIDNASGFEKQVVSEVKRLMGASQEGR